MGASTAKRKGVVIVIAVVGHVMLIIGISIKVNCACCTANMGARFVCVVGIKYRGVEKCLIF